jgi:thiol-disulfide isomerase/thioredoxin
VVSLGARLDARTRHGLTRGRAFVVGSAIGLLWAPCAGPILGLVVAGAVARGGGLGTASLFLAYAAGAATSLVLVLVGGGRLVAGLRRAHGADRFVRPALGTLTIAGVLVIASGWDRALYARAGLASTTAAEADLIQRLTPNTSAAGRLSIGESLDHVATPKPAMVLADEGTMPPLDGATTWINSAPLDASALAGKVVMIDFWTFGCYNCLNALPHVKELEAKYRDKGFVVIGVHTPEFAHEKLLDNVRREVERLGVVYPVAVDNDYRIWRAFENQYWPAAYFIDKAGRIRYHHFGEGRYAEQDAVVEQLLAEPSR